VSDTLDQRLKRCFPVGIRSGTDIKIRLKTGFELFNTRPYHNYETWSQGYDALIDGKVIATAEYLDELVEKIEDYVDRTKGTS